jgi:hypothetical protein
LFYRQDAKAAKNFKKHNIQQEKHEDFKNLKYFVFHAFLGGLVPSKDSGIKKIPLRGER